MKNKYIFSRTSLPRDRNSVTGLNSFVGIKTIHTEYLKYLHETFGFAEQPLILHGIFFKHENYLKTELEATLKERLQVKNMLENPNLSEEDSKILNSKSSSLKLKLNSSYGYSLCRMEAAHSPYTREKLLSTKTIQKYIQTGKTQDIKELIHFDAKHTKVVYSNINTFSATPFVTPSIAIGAGNIKKFHNKLPFKGLHKKSYSSLSGILAHSKIILLKCGHFLLKYLNPRKHGKTLSLTSTHLTKTTFSSASSFLQKLSTVTRTAFIFSSTIRFWKIMSCLSSSRISSLKRITLSTAPLNWPVSFLITYFPSPKNTN